MKFTALGGMETIKGPTRDSIPSLPSIGSEQSYTEDSQAVFFSGWGDALIIEATAKIDAGPEDWRLWASLLI
jgi:hypothetical protein